MRNDTQRNTLYLINKYLLTETNKNKGTLIYASRAKYIFFYKLKWNAYEIKHIS